MNQPTNRSSRKRVSKIDVRGVERFYICIFFAIPEFPKTKNGVSSFLSEYDLSKGYVDFPRAAKEIVEKGTFILCDLTRTPGWSKMDSGERRKKEIKEVGDNRSILFKAVLVRETCR